MNAKQIAALAGFVVAIYAAYAAWGGLRRASRSSTSRRTDLPEPGPTTGDPSVKLRATLWNKEPSQLVAGIRVESGKGGSQVTVIHHRADFRDAK
jgi:hypothetical protein